MRPTATYSPQDDKIRVYPFSRLSDDDYQALKAAGFGWAPKQECFFATWSPRREDAAEALCGEIEDEDTTTEERAEARAERFGQYSESRSRDAERAAAGVSAIADGIPLGQPILVGHHSERRARKDAERIQRGMERAVRMADTANYWKGRAHSAIAHAKYKELPGVRARRIKGLEAELRKMRRTIEEAAKVIRLWSKDGLTQEQAVFLANHHFSYWMAWSDLTQGKVTVEEAKAKTIATYTASDAHAKRWEAHIVGRIEYEREMLGEQGGLAAERFDILPGGRVLVGSTWATVLRVTKREGKAVSVTTADTYCRVVGVERIADYTPPEAGEAAAVARVSKLGPICNYRREGSVEMTSAQYEERSKRDSARMVRLGSNEKHGKHRVRESSIPGGNYWKMHPVFLTDKPEKLPPPPDGSTASAPRISGPSRVVRAPKPAPAVEPPTVFDAIRDSLKAGVVALSADQLFPTPPDLARRMVKLCEEAGSVIGSRILEPSAGTGNLVRAIHAAATGADCVRLTCVEINPTLAEGLRDQKKLTVYSSDHNFEVVEGDFLSLPIVGPYRFVVMNPPFANAADVKHVTKAAELLAPGGRLVAIMANGPRQNAYLDSVGGVWSVSHRETLPDDTFRPCGTSVRTLLVAIDREPA
jgi:predicted RNA methylase